MTLAESCFSHPIASFGAQITLKQERLRLDALLFGESPSRVLLSVKQDHLEQVQHYIQDLDKKVPMNFLGRVTETQQMDVTVQGSKNQISCHMSLSLSDLAARWHSSISQSLAGEPS